MHHHTRTRTFALALRLVSVTLLTGASLLYPQARLVAQPQPSRSSSPSATVDLIPPELRNSNKSIINPAFKKAFDEVNERESIANKKAQQLFEAGKLAEAEQACYDALAVNVKSGWPPGITAQQLLADVYREQGRYKEAIEMYQKSLEHGVGDDAVNFKTALCYLKLGDLKNAHKFYSEEQFCADLPTKKRADYLSMLPGTKTPKTMEASLLYAMGCVQDLHGEPEKANALWEKTLELVPQNALAAQQIAWNLDFLRRRKEAVPYWARAAVFGKGDIAEEGQSQLKKHLMPDKIPQAIADAQKIQ